MKNLSHLYKNIQSTLESTVRTMFQVLFTNARGQTGSGFEIIWSIIQFIDFILKNLSQQLYRLRESVFLVLHKVLMDGQV